MYVHFSFAVDLCNSVTDIDCFSFKFCIALYY